MGDDTDDIDDTGDVGGAVGGAAAELAARSLRELEAGRLPVRARERLDRQAATGAFTSTLSAPAHLLVREAGFVPVGQVMGLAVVSPNRWSGGDCGMRNRAGRADAVLSTAPEWRDSLRDGVRLALDRLRLEADALGADGIVDVRFADEHLADTAFVEQMRVVGTAVRAVGDGRPRAMFTSGLSTADTIALLRTGWAPVSVLYGLEITLRHDDWGTQISRAPYVTRELAGYTELVTAAVRSVRDQLGRGARAAGADGVLLSRLTHRAMVRPCGFAQGAADHLLRASGLATAVVRVPSTHRPRSAARAVVAMSG